MSEVKRYFMRATAIVERIGDAKCDCDTPCQCVVYASDFDSLTHERDAIARERDEMRLALRVGREVLAALSAELAEAKAEIERMREALKHFAMLPLEEFGFDEKPDERSITGFNNWRLTVGHIRKARAALMPAKVKEEKRDA